MKRLIRTATNTCNIAAKPTIDKDLVLTAEESSSASEEFDVDGALQELSDTLILEYDDVAVKKTGQDSATVIVDHQGEIDEFTVDVEDLKDLNQVCDNIKNLIENPEEDLQ